MFFPYFLPFTMLKRGIQALSDDCQKRCGLMSVNTVRRQICLKRCKVMTCQKMIVALKNIGKKYPDRQQFVEKKILSIEKKMQVIGMEVERMERKYPEKAAQQTATPRDVVTVQ